LNREAGAIQSARRVNELEEVREQLEQSMYALVHDLREPLRQIGTQADLLSRRLTPVLDEETTVMFESVREGVDRMRAMIDATLDLGRRTYEPVSIIAVDTQAVMEAVLQNLPVQETKATIRTGYMPSVAANREHVLHIFQNLLGNAIKYRSERPPEITVDASRDGDGWLFTVRDNGIGIDSDDHGHIFEMFRRGRNNAAREGNGLGLATCRKIVERYNGRIWVESAQGDGAAFFFTLPAVPADGSEKKAAQSEREPRCSRASGEGNQ
jgi:light-regulated signal transduction histidine kinase (bacteriophytochrome)